MLGLQLLATGEQGLSETVKLDVRNFSLLPTSLQILELNKFSAFTFTFFSNGGCVFRLTTAYFYLCTCRMCL